MHRIASLKRLITGPSLLLVLASLAVSCVGVGALLLVWRGPWWLDGQYLSTKDLRTGSAALVTGFRTAVVQLLAVFGASVALIFTAINYRLSRRGQVTERFTNALERLGSGELYVRIGGILALEQIVQDAPEQGDHAEQVLTAFVRDRAPQRSASASPRPMQERIRKARRSAGGATLASGNDPRAGSRSGPGTGLPEADVQQALVALTSNHERVRRLQLPGLHLVKAELQGGNLARAMLIATDLTRANLSDADLTDSLLSGARLRQALLFHAKLTGASLIRADLKGAGLAWADLSRARLHCANLDNAYLDAADLRRAHGLTVEQVVSAYPTSETRLPPELANDARVQARIAEVDSRSDR